MDARTASDGSREHSSALRSRRARLETELRALDKLIAIAEAEPDTTQPVVWRIYAVLHTNFAMAFTPAELMDAARANEDATRKALSKLVADKMVDRVGRGTYQLGGWEQRRMSQGWEDP
jgi:hypothetical protein